jgi:hypothetical protein
MFLFITDHLSSYLGKNIAFKLRLPISPCPATPLNSSPVEYQLYLKKSSPQTPLRHLPADPVPEYLLPLLLSENYGILMEML